MRFTDVAPEILEDMLYEYLAKALMEIQEAKKKEANTQKDQQFSD